MKTPFVTQKFGELHTAENGNQKKREGQRVLENVFLLNDSQILFGKPFTPFGDGMFFLYQLSGSSDIIIDGEGRSLSERETFAGETQRGYNINVSDGGGAIFLSVSGMLVSTLSELYGVKDGFFAFAPETLELFEEIRLVFEKKIYNETEKQKDLAITFHKLIHKLHKSSGTRLVRRTALRIKEYIDAHAEEKTELSELSKVFFMSKTQIYRLFKEEYGVSPIKYLIERKIELSKTLLENEDLKISEIAEALSFSDARHFSKTFFRHEGVLPSEYRKNKQ